MTAFPPLPAAARIACVSCIWGLAILALGRPAAASEIMGAAPTRAAPPGLLEGRSKAAKHGAGCHCGRCNTVTSANPATVVRAHHGCGKHGGCGKPGCPAHCPVRPDRFGFYGTQWRTWPGQGVVLTSGTGGATPVLPPKSEVPGPDEESPALPGELQEPAADASGIDAEQLPPAREAAPVEPPAAVEPKGDRRILPDSDASEPPAEPATKEPAVEKPSSPAAEENLFDEASHRRRRSEVLAGLQHSALRAEQARREALRQQVVRVQAGPHVAALPTRPPAADAGVRTVAHEEPATPPTSRPRSNPLR